MAMEKRGDAAGSRQRSLVAAVLTGLAAGALCKLLGTATLTALGAALACFGGVVWIGAMQPERTGELDAATRRQRHRSVAIALCLGALVAIFYIATIVRLGPNALKRDSFGGSGPTKSAPLDPIACKKAGTC